MAKKANKPNREPRVRYHNTVFRNTSGRVYKTILSRNHRYRVENYPIDDGHPSAKFDEYEIEANFKSGAWVRVHTFNDYYERIKDC